MPISPTGFSALKTIVALQFLVHGAQDCKEPGIFVAFEETSKRIVANAESFGWKLAALRQEKLFFMDAQPMSDMIQLRDFDLSGMLAALEAQTKKMRARRIVFDALDVVLALLPDPAAKRPEISPAVQRSTWCTSRRSRRSMEPVAW